uniref:SET domain-containing protein n=1 Tax=Chromera velia CCMP2878 TaxID=1169474 RepID=A0A0G4HXN9_9ALVE|eukprot:Cvel_9305.t1-p1 / transcript=Cvel_9305.t1 / gene=Cvel_9305 / organism=Chromera_velia_CCMP2878 / gene_product=hypothetical protein / transcript_product=hypothetical protein / location=Cvel_scaffold533:24999-26522(+) / protein_length=508 / sequence_SO=supercontig / SO=protein_coding / is_pseudo=false
MESTDALRQSGNDLFLQGKFAEALDVYSSEKLTGDLAAQSNAAEASLRLKDLSQAEKFARRALALDPSHLKSIHRLVCALAGQSRAAEAHAVISEAPISADSENERERLHARCAEHSPECYHFREGLLLEKLPSESFRVVAARPIRSQQCLLKERAVVPWTKEDVFEEFAHRTKTLRDHLQTAAGRQDASKLNGMFPCRYEEIPLGVPSLSNLEARVREMMPSRAAERDVRETTRVLAAAKLNSHDDGCHGFATFLNHSCSFNCEVRGSRNLEIFACRDISAGEELCIPYLALEQLDLCVDWRQIFFFKGWGCACSCDRCSRELASRGLPADFFEASRNREAAEARFTSNMTRLYSCVDKLPRVPTKDFRNLEAALASVFPFRTFDNGSCHLKALDHLCHDFQSRALSLQLSAMQNPSSLCEVAGVEEALALADELYSMRKRFIPELSSLLHDTRALLTQLISLLLIVLMARAHEIGTTSAQLIRQQIAELQTRQALLVKQNKQTESL